jgi:hypothetical protein
MSLVMLVTTEPIRDRGLADAACWGESNYWLATTHSSYHLISLSICRPTTGSTVHGPRTSTAHDLKFKWPYHLWSEITGRFCGGVSKSSGLLIPWALSNICWREEQGLETASAVVLHLPDRKVFHTVDGGNEFLRNVCNTLPISMTSHYMKP